MTILIGLNYSGMITNEIREILQKVCSKLNQNKVDYILVGGTAVGYHGYKRISGATFHKPELKTDLDFWYKPVTENFINLIRALKELGIDDKSLDSIVFDPQKTFLKIPHTVFHTDFLPIMAGLDSFDECKRNAIQEFVDNNPIWILSYNDLIKNKLAVGRPIDKDDLSNLRHQEK